GSWDLLVRFKAVPHSQAAAPLDVAVTLGRLLTSGPLLKDSGYSLIRLSSGIAIGCVLAVVFCLGATLYRTISAFLGPTVQLLAGVPVVLWMPFCVMFFGT